MDTVHDLLLAIEGGRVLERDACILNANSVTGLTHVYLCISPPNIVMLVRSNSVDPRSREVKKRHLLIRNGPSEVEAGMKTIHTQS